jgi:hypothetical protein
MKAPVDLIGAHTATGASTTVHELGKSGSPGQASGIALAQRIVTVTGTFTGTVKLEVSLDNSNYFDLITGITSAQMYVIPDGYRYLRSNCTAYTSGTINVHAQKFVEA